MKIRILLLVAVIGCSQASFAMQSSVLRTNLQIAKLIGCGISGLGCAYTSCKCLRLAKKCYDKLRSGNGSVANMGAEIASFGSQVADAPDHCNVNSAVMNKTIGLGAVALGGGIVIFDAIMNGALFCVGGISLLGSGLSGYGSYRFFKAALNARNALSYR